MLEGEQLGKEQRRQEGQIALEARTEFLGEFGTGMKLNNTLGITWDPSDAAVPGTVAWICSRADAAAVPHCH